MPLPSVVIYVLQSSRTTILLAVCWMINIAFAWAMLPPTGDLGFFVGNALNVVTHGHIGLQTYAGEMIPAYLPGFLYIYGLGFALLELSGIGITWISYQAVHLLLLVGALTTGAILARRCSAIGEKDDNWSATNFFFVLTAATPFVFDCYQVRPEMTGLLLLFCAMLTSIAADRQPQDVTPWRWFVAGLLLGIAGTCHPSFIVLGSVVGVVIIIRLVSRKNWHPLVLLLVGALLPMTLLVVSILLRPSAAQQSLFAHIASRSKTAGQIPGTSLLMIFRYVVEAIRQPGAITFYWGLFFAVLALVVSTTVITICITSSRIMQKGLESILPLALAVGGFILLLVTNHSKIQYYVVVSAVWALWLGVVFSKSKIQLAVYNASQSPWNHLIVTTLSLAVLTNTLIHLSKFLFFDTGYYSVSRMRTATLPRLKDDEPIVMTNNELAAPFMERFVQLYRGDREYGLYELDTFAFHEGIEQKSLRNAKNHLEGKIALWAIDRKGIVYNDSTEIQLRYRYQYHDAEIHLKPVESLFEDHNHYVLRAQAKLFKFQQRP